jgi:peptide deformylase
MKFEPPGKGIEMDEIRVYPDPILMKEAEPVPNMDGQVKEIVDRMIQAMYANHGIGLAAPQIGIPLQIFVAGDENGWRGFINPEVLAGEGESTLEEGCLSLPDLVVPVKRKETVFIRAWNLDGKEMNLEVSGFPGRVYQHEIDHLSGILIIDYISRLKRRLSINKMMKDQKRSQFQNKKDREICPEKF